MTHSAPQPAPEPAPHTGPPRWLAWSTRYTDHVAEVCTTPAGRADLASGHSLRALAEPWRMLPHVRTRIPRHAGDTKIAYLAVAAMYAAYAPNPATVRQDDVTTWNPAHGDFGWSLALAVQRGVLREESATELLKDLARKRELPALIRRLQPVVRRLADAGVPLSWPRLLNHLVRWPRYRTDIADQWMYSHYAPTTIPDGEAEESAA
ncbi:type I-E CRISPR-associated protein Cse2/CasB [Streptomyces xanthochromogenes]|uniref:Type I-E CRISPR-associated protein Cse2/CasB n=1 Tax=Streptomyces xanthochromogenes TaxID=67384 RepID=A0ABQ2ZH08_9ACTN|nr:type I-E CRISPR-associated protein Cse2/CasB [Streptomyces xanthochromogenes]GGY13210.1 hypothetical protein GCM10010326_00520 [Streptomyces xanthochromogenes]